ncbi:MAG: cell division protein FtsL [Thermoanaerobaculia bacterium]
MQRTYAVHRPVVNDYLVRDRDRRRMRELLQVVAIALPVLVVLLVSVGLHSEVLATGYRTHSLERELEALSQLERRLELEAAYLASPQRVERLAAERLGLSIPSAEQIVFVEELQVEELE